MRTTILFGVLLMAVLSGCFVEPSAPPDVIFSGSVTETSSGEYRVAGDVFLSYESEEYAYREVHVCVWWG